MGVCNGDSDETHCNGNPCAGSNLGFERIGPFGGTTGPRAVRGQRRKCLEWRIEVKDRWASRVTDEIDNVTFDDGIKYIIRRNWLGVGIAEIG